MHTSIYELLQQKRFTHWFRLFYAEASSVSPVNAFLAYVKHDNIAFGNPFNAAV